MMRVPKTVLLATDGADDAVMARDAAVQLCARWEAQLHIVHAWRMPLTAMSYPGYAIPSNWQGMFDADHAAVLEEECARVAAAGGTVAGRHLVHGGAVDAVIDVAAKIGADLIVMGTHGRGTLGRLFAGSVTSGVLHHATPAVLVVRQGDATWPPAEIVIGDDYGVPAESAADVALALASALHAPVKLFHAISMLSEVEPAACPTVEVPLETVTKRTAERAAEFSTPEVEVAPVTAFGDAAGMLIAAANHGTGLIAVGRHARKRGLLVGSVSNYLLHEAVGAMLVGPAATVAPGNDSTQSIETPAAAGAGLSTTGRGG